MGPLLPEAEGVEQLIVDSLHDLTDRGYPASELSGPASLFGVTLGLASLG